MNGNIRLIGILVLGMLVLAMVQVVGAQGEHTWYFTGDDASAPTYSGADYNKIMTKWVEGGDDKITLAPGERVWFYADELAACDVTFPAGSWDVSYWVKTLNAYDGSKRLYTRLHNVTSDGGHTEIKGTWGGISYNADIQEYSKSLIPDEPFTVKKDGGFAIEILWQSGDQGNLEIHCNPSGEHASKATSPSSDPGYPVPELPTVILFSTGLITLAGYVLLTKKRN